MTSLYAPDAYHFPEFSPRCFCTSLYSISNIFHTVGWSMTGVDPAGSLLRIHTLSSGDACDRVGAECWIIVVLTRV